MIVVFDTNIWISALFFGGKPEQAILKAYEEDEMAICQQIADEIEEVAIRKFAQQAGQIKDKLERLMVNALWVTVRGELKVSRDPDDDIVLECARNAQAHIIVSGDNDLLDLRQFSGIHILTADQYLSGAEPHPHN
ncbi:MAG: putative toxin-antitoxin system toxin component, PIN family [Candidatus Angelobacter sp.]